MTGDLLVRGAEVDGRLVDVHVRDGRVASVGGPVAAGGDDLDVVDAAAGALLPGLHDHHLHLLALAARLGGVDLDPLRDPGAVDRALTESVGAAAAAGGDGWLRVGGYDEHRHGALDRRRLDTLVGPAAVRVQHRSGLSWVLSTEALVRVGLGDGGERPPGVELDRDGEPTGWLHRLDGWLADRVPRADADLAAVGRSLAARGLTGVTDATVDLGPSRAEALSHAVAVGWLPQRLVVLGVDERSSVAGWAELGPAKLVADETAGLSPSDLAEEVASHHGSGRAVAIHAVTRAENVTAVSGLAQAGAWAADRIEHGSVLPTELDPVLAAAGVTVVVQPSLVAERGDHHLGAVEAADLPLLHRHRSLLAAGVRVGVGSDAPVTTFDPWVAVAAASRRTTRSGAVVGPSEAVEPEVALGWYLAHPLDPGGPPRQLRPGAPADLCLLDVPLAEALARPSAEHVRVTWIDGRKVHG